MSGRTVSFTRPNPDGQWAGAFLCGRGRGGPGCVSLSETERVELHYLQLVVRLPVHRGNEPRAVHYVDDVSEHGQHAWSIDWSDANCGRSGIYHCTEARCVPEGELAVFYTLGEWGLWRRARVASLPIMKGVHHGVGR